MSSQKCNGLTNSATYLTALYLQQERSIEQQIIALLKRSALNAETMKGLVSSVSIAKDDDVMTGLFDKKLLLDSWAEGDINWQEIATVLSDGMEVVPDPVSSELQQLMAVAIIEGKVVRFERKFDRATYLMVDEAMQAIGGKWNKKEQGHVFPSDPSDLIEAIVESGTFERQKTDNFGFFPTPPDLVREMLHKAGVTPGARVFEPNAGNGAIAELAAEIVGYGNVVTLELQETNAAILRKKGFNPIVGDFLAYESDERFHFVLMNPPFAKQQDINHVMHAWKFLAQGGRMIAIMSASVKFRENAKTSEFRAFLESHGGVITDNPAGAFKSSGTGVSTVTIAIDKPAYPVALHVAPVIALPVKASPVADINFWLDDDEVKYA
jgi:predicted RNA methylase